MARTSSKSKVVKSIPNTETGAGVTCISSEGEYLITQNPLKAQFTLWKCAEDGYEKIKSSDSPLDLYELVPW